VPAGGVARGDGAGLPGEPGCVVEATARALGCGAAESIGSRGSSRGCVQQSHVQQCHVQQERRGRAVHRLQCVGVSAQLYIKIESEFNFALCNACGPTAFIDEQQFRAVKFRLFSSAPQSDMLARARLHTHAIIFFIGCLDQHSTNTVSSTTNHEARSERGSTLHSGASGRIHRRI